jgi:hypothetical protein
MFLTFLREVITFYRYYVIQVGEYFQQSYIIFGGGVTQSLHITSRNHPLIYIAQYIFFWEESHSSRQMNKKLQKDTQAW